jgi:DNA excision repair protein ERCC-8
LDRVRHILNVWPRRGSDDAMLRELRALENGEPSTAHYQLRCERWSSLDLDIGRSILPDGDGLAEIFYTLDVDSLSGRLILAGGSARSSSPAGTSHGCVGVYAIPGDAQSIPAAPGTPSPPLAWAAGPEADGSVVTAKWLPGDVSMFVTASSRGILAAWDAETFVPCAQYTMLENSKGERASVAALHLSSAPGGRPELIAVASVTSSDVKLLDLSSGSFTHSLSGHTAGLTDVRWSPTDGHLLATTSNDGTVRMFDVRRAGTGACLCVFDHYKTLESAAQAYRLQQQQRLQQSLLRQQLESQQLGPSPAKRAKKKQQQGLESTTLLGLGMAWEAADDTSALSHRKRLARRELTAGRSGASIRSHQGSASRVRFTGDGSAIISGGTDNRLRVWDALSGHCVLSSFAGVMRGATRLFELSTDSSVLLSNIRSGMATHDVSSGKLLSSLRGHLGTMTAMAVHGFREEAFTASSEGEIFSWTPQHVHGGRGSPQEP